MSAITTPPSSGPASEERMTRRGAGPAKKVLLVLASLRITVVLFVLSLILVFCGTLAQRDAGIWTVVNHYFRGDWKTAGFIWIPLKNLIFFSVPGGFPFPGGFLLGSALMVNLLAAHAVRFRFTWRRSGVLILHAGVLLLLVGEFITREYAVEGNMSIYENASANYIEHRDSPELAVVSSADARTDDVVTVPAHLLRPGQTVRHPDLPFDIEVVRYMPNSAFPEKGQPGAANPATAGEGLHVIAVERRPTSGADTDQKVDMPSAYLTLRAKGTEKSLGTYLFSLWLTDAGSRFPLPQTVTVDGKSYDVSLRFKRTYKPYTIRLLEFKHDRYERTDVAKNFSSLVRLEDPSRDVNRQALIYMNNPLRYEGETFYQAEVRGEDEGTILQVVRNPGWRLPYISCSLVAIGMLIHFGLTLTGFLRKQLARVASPGSGLPPGDDSPAADESPVLAALPGPRGGSQVTARPAARGAPGRIAAGKHRKPAPVVAAAPAVAAAADSTLAGIFPWAVLGLGVLWVAVAMALPTDPPGKMRLEEFANLPVSQGGRIKPIDTVARNSLLAVSDRQTYYDADGRQHSAVEWLLGLMTFAYFDNHEAVQVPVVRIENDQVLAFLELKARSGFRYSIAELLPKLKEVEDQANRAGKKDEASRDLFDTKIMDLARRVHLIGRLTNLADPATLLLPSGGQGTRTWKEVIAEADRDREVGRRLTALARMIEGMRRMNVASALQPPADTSWRTGPEAILEARQTNEVDPALLAYAGMLDAYSRKDVAGFNKSLDDYRAEMDARTPQGSQMAGLERFFNNFEPFYQCALLYVFVFLLGCLSWVGWSRPLGRAAFWLGVLTWGVHTLALIARMYLMHRPPVTNLYSSAIFIGWAGVGLCLALEPLFRLRICTVVAAVAGGTTMLIAHLLATGDTMEMLQAVLDTNFWLATHVTCVTIGYATTYLAGLFAMAWISCAALRLKMPSLDRGILTMLSQVTYGVVCFAMFFSFVGTVLGGIWADQSWGRFWGWDPKENGAVLIVIWNALILHARWAGLVKARGVAVLAVVGNIVTSWSWFGTNQLGIGLHAYGFTNGAFWGLVGAVVFFLLWLVGGWVLPQRAWR